jgi:predicted transcriptional regulator
MRSVTLSVASWEDVGPRIQQAMQGDAQAAQITFASADLLWQVLTRRRWDLLQVMIGAGPVSLRALARRLGRDVKTVRGDVQALIMAGIIDRTEAGKILFPYDGVHVDFRLMAA